MRRMILLAVCVFGCMPDDGDGDGYDDDDGDERRDAMTDCWMAADGGSPPLLRARDDGGARCLNVWECRERRLPLNCWVLYSDGRWVTIEDLCENVPGCEGHIVPHP